VDQAADKERIVQSFAELWWSDRSIFVGQTWLGIPTLQHPFDAWVTQEIIVETHPERIVGRRYVRWIRDDVGDAPRTRRA
jgi:cephalosporin hydroxylase